MSVVNENSFKMPICEIPGCGWDGKYLRGTSPRCSKHKNTDFGANPTKLGLPDPLDLLPCPFCEVLPTSRICGDGETWVVACEETDCGFAAVHRDTEAEAIAQWNTRRPAPAGSPLLAPNSCCVPGCSSEGGYVGIGNGLRFCEQHVYAKISEGSGSAGAASPGPVGREAEKEIAALEIWKAEAAEAFDKIMELTDGGMWARFQDVIDAVASLAASEAKPADASEAEPSSPTPKIGAPGTAAPAGGLDLEAVIAELEAHRNECGRKANFASHQGFAVDAAFAEAEGKAYHRAIATLRHINSNRRVQPTPLQDSPAPSQAPQPKTEG